MLQVQNENEKCVTNTVGEQLGQSCPTQTKTQSEKER